MLSSATLYQCGNRAQSRLPFITQPKTRKDRELVNFLTRHTIYVEDVLSVVQVCHTSYHFNNRFVLKLKSFLNRKVQSVVVWQTLTVEVSLGL